MKDEEKLTKFSRGMARLSAETLADEVHAADKSYRSNLISDTGYEAVLKRLSRLMIVDRVVGNAVHLGFLYLSLTSQNPIYETCFYWSVVTLSATTFHFLGFMADNISTGIGMIVDPDARERNKKLPGRPSFGDLMKHTKRTMAGDVIRTIVTPVHGFEQGAAHLRMARINMSNALVSSGIRR